MHSPPSVKALFGLTLYYFACNEAYQPEVLGWLAGFSHVCLAPFPVSPRSLQGPCQGHESDDGKAKSASLAPRKTTMELKPEGWFGIYTGKPTHMVSDFGAAISYFAFPSTGIGMGQHADHGGCLFLSVPQSAKKDSSNRFCSSFWRFPAVFRV